MKNENFEYKTIIEFNRNVNIDEMKKIAEVVNKAFDNRAGKAQNLSHDPYIFIYAGNENLFGCLQLGMLALEEQTTYLSYIIAWNWIDMSQSTENEDILAEIMTSIR